jgi:hypothetical protein
MQIDNGEDPDSKHSSVVGQNEEQKKDEGGEKGEDEEKAEDEEKPSDEEDGAKKDEDAKEEENAKKDEEDDKAASNLLGGEAQETVKKTSIMEKLAS